MHRKLQVLMAGVRRNETAVAKFGQMVASIRGTQSWNTLPAHVRDCDIKATFEKTFKQWL